VATYIILSRLSPEAFDDPKKFKELAERGVSEDQETVSGYQLEGQLRYPGTLRCRRPRRSRRSKANREGGDDYSCLWTFRDGNTRRDSVEGVPGYAVKSVEQRILIEQLSRTVN